MQCAPPPTQFQNIDPIRLETVYTILQGQHNTILENLRNNFDNQPTKILEILTAQNNTLLELTNNLVKQNKTLEHIGHHLSLIYQTIEDYKKNLSANIASGLIATLCFGASCYIISHIIMTIYSSISTFIKEKKIISQKDIDVLIKKITKTLDKENIKKKHIDIIINNFRITCKKQLMENAIINKNLDTNIIKKKYDNLQNNYNTKFSNIEKEFSFDEYLNMTSQTIYLNDGEILYSDELKQDCMNILYDKFLLLNEKGYTDDIEAISLRDPRGIIIKNNYIDSKKKGNR